MENSIKNKEVDLDEIKKQVKELLKNFSNSLNSVESIKSFEQNRGLDECVERVKQFRLEKNKENNLENSFFRKIMFKNSPNSEGDLIFGEKKKW